MNLNNYQQFFFDLVRVGLWCDQWPVSGFKFQVLSDEDWEAVYQLSQEQSVQGLVLQGIDWFKNHNDIFSVNIPQGLLLQWIGEVQVIERRNKEMNGFIADLIEKLRKYNIYAILVKGQGIAQCYERPLWRSSGDIDLLLNECDYEKAKRMLLPLATNVEQEFGHIKHLGMTVDGWAVELHGTLHSRLSRRVDNGIDYAQREIFFGRKARSWLNGKTQVFLPAPLEDVIIIFTHILQHFYIEGIGLRQICDWCRLLWTYKTSLDYGLLKLRIQKMGLMTEWKAFAAFAVKWLGMPVEAMPFYTADARWESKADRICSFVLKVGNFGHKQRRDYSGMSYLKRKIISVWRRLSDMLRHFQLFPKDSILFFGGVLRSGLYAVTKGE